VHGKVTFADGTPVKGGMIEFHPTENEVGGKLRYDGGALIDAEGHYKAGRNGDGKGLVPGEYVVTVGPREIGELPGSNAGRVPKQFRDRNSPLRITVGESDNTINVSLK
jgi:hypothetical protein